MVVLYIFTIEKEEKFSHDLILGFEPIFVSLQLDFDAKENGGVIGVNYSK